MTSGRGRIAARFVATAQIAVVAGLLFFSGCGYALVGRGTVVDPSIRRIGVPTFVNGSGKALLDQKVTQRVIEELLRRGRFDVVQERTGVDALVEGELLRYDARPVGFSEGATGGSRLQDGWMPYVTTPARDSGRRR